MSDPHEHAGHDSREMDWMYHCHILEHHAGGMMAHFEVVR
jgi:FtsP/CotA-like multicopper oxidase with cupredoxin domain